MKRFNYFVVILCALIVVSLSGCALLAVPATIIGESFKLIGQVLKIAAKMPKPPPGVF